MAAERSLERLGADRFDVLLLHNPDRTGYTSAAVWDGMAALRDEGLASAIGVAPGPANGFTLDLLDCFERFGERLDWAMVILNPFEPWPGELVLDAAARHGIDVITRVVDYGGLFWGDVARRRAFPQHDHRRFRPEGWVERGGASASPSSRRSPSGGPDADAVGVRLEPRPPRRPLRRADADPGGRRRARGRSRTSAPSSRRCRRT